MSQKRYQGGPMAVSATGANITTGAASASATIPNNGAGNIPDYIYLACTAAAHVRLGVSAATAVATDLLLRPEMPIVLQVAKGMTKIAAIQDTAAGVVTVTPLDNA